MLFKKIATMLGITKRFCPAGPGDRECSRQISGSKTGSEIGTTQEFMQKPRVEAVPSAHWVH
jgi:hypothetical protein